MTVLAELEKVLLPEWRDLYIFKNKRTFHSIHEATKIKKNNEKIVSVAKRYSSSITGSVRWQAI